MKFAIVKDVAHKLIGQTKEVDRTYIRTEKKLEIICNLTTINIESQKHMH